MGGTRKRGRKQSEGEEQLKNMRRRRWFGKQPVKRPAVMPLSSGITGQKEAREYY
jgi:hypothetical protein